MNMIRQIYHPSFTPDEIALWERVILFIESEGKSEDVEGYRFDMSQWGINEHWIVDTTSLCDTAACIGGTAEFLVYGNISLNRGEWEVAAQLGMDQDEADRLFYPSNFNKTPDEALRTIRRFLQTREIIW